MNWHYNGFKWPLSRAHAWQEQTATGYVRPHEWALAGSGTPMLFARISKIHAAGPLTHLSVQPGSGNEIHVTFAGSEAAQHGFAIGQNIALSPKQIYIFSQNQLIDYAI